MVPEVSTAELRTARKVFEGVVVSDKMTKTRVVLIERLVRHPFYEKVMRKTTRLVAHDEESLSKLGDRVQVMSSRPISKTKRWRLVRIVKKAPPVFIREDSKSATGAQG
jgi:small subunit ribosomal protein S17